MSLSAPPLASRAIRLTEVLLQQVLLQRYLKVAPIDWSGAS